MSHASRPRQKTLRSALSRCGNLISARRKSVFHAGVRKTSCRCNFRLSAALTHTEHLHCASASPDRKCQIGRRGENNLHSRLSRNCDHSSEKVRTHFCFVSDCVIFFYHSSLGGALNLMQWSCSDLLGAQLDTVSIWPHAN
jgi:hypothetical protein